jgi:transposase InsO family protein
MREQGIKPKTVKKFRVTTDSKHSLPVQDNILNREFNVTSLNRRWAGDITYIPLQNGWLYLATVIDLCSRRVIGWSMSDRMQTTLVSDALKMALSHRGIRSAASLLWHSDRGSQYASYEYQRLLKQHGLRGSMSRKGNCWDNAVSESFFSSLKKELVHHERYANQAEAKRSIFEYLEVFYNRQRRHSSLGYLPPAEFERLMVA